MNPWVAGRIIEQMQIEARGRAHKDRLAHQVADHRHEPGLPGTRPHDSKRERFGLAVARVGLRIAGRSAEQIAGSRAFAAQSHPLEASR
jgi:hypothetical protein